jgi:hypothetical protein
MARWTGRARAARRLASSAGCAVLAACAVSAGQAAASEAGTNVYLLGTGGPESAIMPPLKGVYFDDQTYYYNGAAGASKQFQIGGLVVAGVHASVLANFPAVAWVPTTNLIGGTLSVGGVLPFGEPQVNVDAVLTGPKGRTFSLSRNDSAWLLGDPLATAALGWKWGDYHLQLAELFNIPVGQYRVGRLANIAFHRFAADTSLAGTWHDDASGWDVSAKAGITANGENPATDYDTGAEAHLELSMEKIVSKAFSVGLLAYRFNQITADSGDGNRVGDFEGRENGVGLTAAWNFKLGEKPAVLRLRGFQEFDSAHKLQGNSAFVELSFPLKMKMPPRAPGAPAHP